jgi:hypothetical protein
MPHILAPKSGQTMEQSYSGIGYKNAQGHTECVEFIKQTLGAPYTGAWKEGTKVKKGDTDIASGTAIATFIDGKYPQTGDTGKHAAIYLGQNDQGLQVLDQWRAQGMVKPRTIHWISASADLSNHGDAFSVIEW